MGNRADSDGAAPSADSGDHRPDTQALSQALSVLQSFHEAFVLDRAAGKIRPVADYVSLFPGFEDIVREQYRVLREDDPPVRVPSTPGPVLSRILGAGLRNLKPTQEVARGGMGVVYRVRDEVLHRDLAMKVLLDETARIHMEGGEGKSPTLHAGTALRRMVQEAQITAQLSHPGIVPVHEMGIDSDGRLFFTMTMVRGRTLFEIFRLVQERREGWTQTRALQVFIRICDTLAYAHSKGVIHRDIKPSNIMVGAFGEVLVMDWGVAKVLKPEPGSDPLTMAGPPPLDTPEVEEADPLTHRGDVLGTPEYMPSEQAMGRIDLLDRRADVYSVGAMLYELLAGVPPYHDPDGPRTPIRILQAVTRGPPTPVESLAPGVAPELAAISRRAMERDPAARYQTAEELANDLHRFLEGRVVLAHRRGPFLELRAWIRRNRVLAGTIAGSVLLLVSGAILYGFEQRDAARIIAGERDAARVAEVRAQEERRLAVGNQLAAQAAAEVSRAPALALQLAVEAAERAPGPAATDALYAALARSQERRRLVGHDGYLVGGSWSPDGTRALTWEDGACAILWDTETGALLQRFLCGEGRILRAAFAPDGMRVATAESRGTIRLWDAASGKPLKVLTGHEGQVAVVAFSPDGRVLASGGDDGTVRLWSAAGGEEIRVLKGHEGPIRDLAFSPEGDRLASISGDATGRVWDRASGEMLFRVETRGGDPDLRQFPGVHSYRIDYLDRVMFAAGGRGLVTSAGNLRIHALEAGGPRLVLAQEQAVQVTVSGDGRRVAALVWLGKAKWAIQRWDAADGALTASVPVRDRYYGLALDAAGRRVAAAFEGFDAEVWDLDAGRRVSVLRGHRYPVNTTCWAPDDARVLTCSSDMTGRIWAAEPPDAVRLPPACPSEYLSDDGSRLLQPEGDLGAAAVPVSILDTTTGRSTARFTVPGPVVGVGWLADGRHFRTRGPAGIRIYDAASGKETLAIPPNPDPAGWSNPGTATPDFSRVLFHQKGGKMVVYDAATGRWLDGPTGSGHYIPFLSPDGRRILTEEGSRRTATLWGLDPLRTIRVFTNHNGYAIAGAWSPDGKLIASAAVDGVVHLIDADTGVEGVSAGPVPLQQNYPSLGNGHRWLLVKGQNSSEILLFDTQTGERLATLREPDDVGAIQSAWFIEGTDAVATTTGDGGQLRLWPFDPLSVARTRLPIEIEPEIVKKFQLLSDEAREAYQEKWLRRHPTARGFIGRANVLLKRGSVEGATEWLEATRAIRPDYPDIDWTEACIRARRAAALPAGTEKDREVEKALACLSRTIERGNESTERASKERARNEKNLASLRDDPRFKAMVGE